MALESLDELKAHLSESIARRSKTICDLEQQSATIQSELGRAKEAHLAAQAQCEEAERSFIDAQRKKEDVGRTVRDLERQKTNLPNSIKRAKNLNDDDLEKVRRLERRAQLIQAKVNLDKWSHLFVWSSVAQMSESHFENLIRQLDLMLQAIAELREARTELERLIDAMTSAEGGSHRQESMLALSDAGYRLREAREQYAAARDRVIEAQLVDLKEQQDALPKWSPAAHDDAHDATTAKKFKTREKIEERRRLLEEAWPKLPEST